MAIKGIPIIYVKRIQIGVDFLNNPVYELTEEIVENVLVAPATSDDIINNSDLEGKKAVYTLGIPKGDSHDWTDCQVKFFNKTWKSFGEPIQGIESLVPTQWHKKVMVELNE